MGTEYLVMREEESGLWEPLVTIEVDGGQRAAIRKATEQTTENGRFVAVPTRSWNPEEVIVEVERRVRFAGPETAQEPEPEDGAPPPPPQSPGEAAAAAAAADEEAATPVGRPLSAAPDAD